MSVPAAAALLAILAVASAACARRGAGGAPGVQPVEYVRRTFRSSLAGCTDPAAGAPVACVQLALDYVEATRATVELAQAVDELMRATVLQPLPGFDPPPDVESLRHDLYERYRALRDANPDYGERWRLERSLSVACSGDRVQGLVAVERSFIDDAGVERITYASLGTLDGRRLGLDDLVAPEDAASFLAALERAAEPARGAVPAGVFERGGAAGAGRARLGEPDQVLICPDDLRFRWSADPSLDVVVSRAAVRTLLRAEAP